MRMDLAASFWLKFWQSASLRASYSSIFIWTSSGLPGLPLGLNWLILGSILTILYFPGLPRLRIDFT
jgi:hypothetical protein